MSFSDASPIIHRALTKGGLSLASVDELSILVAAKDDRSQWTCYPSGDWLYEVELTLTLKLKETDSVVAHAKGPLVVPSRWLAKYGIKTPAPYTQFKVYKRDDI
jgi:hypothetical protein